MGSKTPFPRLDRPKRWTVERLSQHPLLVLFLDEIDKAAKEKLLHHEVLKYNEDHFAGYITVSGANKDKIPELRRYIARTFPYVKTEPSPMSDYSFLYKYEVK